MREVRPMPTYTYTAKNVQTGKKVKGTREAENPGVAQKMLQEQGLKVLELKAKDAKKKKGMGFGGRIKPKDKSVFCRQFSTMINAGVHLVRCLDVLEQQAS